MTDSEVKSTKTKSRSYVQWIATLGAFILMEEIGIIIGWASPNLPRFSSGNGTIHLTEDEISWMVSLTGLGGIPGSIFGCVFMEYLGSKNTVLTTIVVVASSWTFIFFANSATLLYVSRFLAGITCAMSYACFSLFVGEIASPEIRGTLVSLASGGNPFGIVVGTVMETYLDMKITTSVYLAQCIVAIILFIWFMDSPYRYAKKDDYDNVRKSLIFYHGDGKVEEELSEIKAFITADANQTIKERLLEFRHKALRKSMYLIIILFALPHVSGMLVIMSYMATILEKGKSNLIDPKDFVIYANIAGIVATLLTVRLIDNLGRRFLLIVSSLGTAIATICLGLHFYLLSIEYDIEKIEWLPVFSMAFYVITYSIGYATVPSTVLSEIFPENMKGIAGSVAAISASIVGFILTKAYQPAIDALGEMYVFWMLAAFSLLAIPCTIFMLPETKGKTFQEIQEILLKK